MKFNKLIDHTLLKPESTKEQILELCQEAKEYDFMSVCVNPLWVSTAYQALKDTDVLVCTVVGFPLGANTTTTKVFEAQEAIKNGASEIDMVLNIGWMKEKNYQGVQEDIQAVAEAVHKEGKLLKVILENCLLEKEEIQKACQLAKEAGADFVKTSTGFSTSGAKVEDIELMRNTVGEDLGVKASGGIRDLKTAQKMVENGANRLGVSAGVQIMKEYNEA
ncbi:MAG: deoxyribose-phosphate aldolase [Tissierellia bacterium]|nr:deoxyribose-phosphate aldolase [Tissierellia bacterium]